MAGRVVSCRQIVASWRVNVGIDVTTGEPRGGIEQVLPTRWRVGWLDRRIFKRGVFPGKLRESRRLAGRERLTLEENRER